MDCGTRLSNSVSGESNFSCGASESQQRQSASDRERSRMRDMNEAFDKLRKKLNHCKPGSKKLSKIQALRLAIQYIAELDNVLWFSSWSSFSQPQYAPGLLPTHVGPCSSQNSNGEYPPAWVSNPTQEPCYDHVNTVHPC